jgi:hypothetical protein
MQLLLGSGKHDVAARDGLRRVVDVLFVLDDLSGLPVRFGSG